MGTAQRRVSGGSSTDRARRRFAVTCLAFYLLALVPLTLLQVSQVGISSTIETLVEWLRDNTPLINIRYGHVEAAANVALFLPIGFLGALALRRGRWWVAALGGMGLSLLVEGAQLALPSGRLATLRDIICNSLGAFLGAVLAALTIVAWEAYASRRGSRSRTTLTHPSHSSHQVSTSASSDLALSDGTGRTNSTNFSGSETPWASISTRHGGVSWNA